MRKSLNSVDKPLLVLKGVLSEVPDGIFKGGAINDPEIGYSF
jgi:hypothetical protein